jgi:hypothetical protein
LRLIVTFIDDDELRCTVSVRLSLRKEALTLLPCLHLLSGFVSELLAELLALLLAAAFASSLLGLGDGDLR